MEREYACLNCNKPQARAAMLFTVATRAGICCGCGGSVMASRLCADRVYRAAVKARLAEQGIT